MSLNITGVLQFDVFVFSTVVSLHRGIPNYDFKIGRITFIRNSRPQPKKFVDDVSRAMFGFCPLVAIEYSNILLYYSVLHAYVFSSALRTML